MKLEIYVTVVWNKFDNRPEYLDRVAVTVRDWDKDFDNSLVREHSANGSLGRLYTERDVFNYVTETLDMFEEEGIEIPDTISYNVERNDFRNFKRGDFGTF